MRSTLATAFLLATSSPTVAEHNQVHPSQLSHRVVKTPDKLTTESSPTSFLRDSRKHDIALALSAADESRTIENVATSAVHSISDSSGALSATRDAVRDIVDLNAFPREVGRPRFDLNFPPSETLALATEASSILQRNHASTSTASEVAVSSRRTKNQRTAKMQARSDTGRKATTRNSIRKKRFKRSAALRATESKESAHVDLPTSAVDKVYTLYLEHLTTESLRFDATKEEIEAMLNMYTKSSVDVSSVSRTYLDFFGQSTYEDLEVLEQKLGMNRMSALRSLASLDLPLQVLRELKRPFVWYASLVRWRAMYCDFFEFVQVNKLTNLLSGVEVQGIETIDAVNGKLLDELRKEVDFETIKKRIDRLTIDVKKVMATYRLNEETAAAIRKVGRQFLKNDVEPSTVASHSQPKNQRTNLLPQDSQTSVSGASFPVIDHARGKRS